MKVDCAQLSLIGDRRENQDRVSVITHTESCLLLAADGMGGHPDGGRAAEVAAATLQAAFLDVPRPVFDPQGFLTHALGRAHEAVVALAPDAALAHRPRTTCAVCLVQDGNAYWAHIGDSRIYHIRDGAVRERTRDHSHVELLLHKGLIGEDEMRDHPMRNFVEGCLGGHMRLPDMSISGRKRLAPRDVLVVCSDGFWSGLREAEFAAAIGERSASLQDALRLLGETAVANTAPAADNTTAAALRWPG